MSLKNRKQLSKKDPLLPEVLEFAVSVEEVSISLIQRRFQLGYPRAARLVDLLVEEGFAKEQTNGPRKVLLSQEEFNRLYGKDSKK